MNGKTCGLTMLVALGAALFAPVTAAQTVFEGQVVGTMTMPDGKVAQFRYYQLGSRIRQEYEIENQTMTSIFDGATGDDITLIPQQKKYMIVNYRQMGEAARRMAGAMGGGQGGRQEKAPDFTKTKVTATGRHETIAGLDCEHYLFENTESHSQIDMCGAAGHGFMGMSGQAGSMMPSTVALLRSQNPELARLGSRGFFPLKMIIASQHEQRPVVWQVTSFSFHRPDASLFAPPAGYTKLELPGMGGGHR
jgi:uncharacterized protein DUF4412